MQGLENGMRVQLTGLGTGKVVRLTRTGVVVSVDAANGLEIEWPQSKVFPLEQITKDQKTVKTHIEVPEKPRVGSNIHDIRIALETLRFGLVPESQIDTLSLGFKVLERWTVSCLPHSKQGQPATSIVQGPFGTGKSHAMAVVRYVAKKNGYLVARVEVDGQNISLSNPEKLLCSLWNTLCGEDFHTATPLLDLYVQAIDRGYPGPRVVRSGIDRIYDNYSVIESLRRSGSVDSYSSELDVILSSGDEHTVAEVNRLIRSDPKIPILRNTLKRIIDTKVDERPECFLQSLIGAALIAKFAGYKGLVITIDEFEVETNLTKANFMRVYTLLLLLMNYLTGKTNYSEAPLALFWATVGDENNINEALLHKIVNLAGGAIYQLQSWEREELLSLAEKVHELYRVAYSIDKPFYLAFANRVVDTLESKGYGDSGMIRAFIKLYLTILDMEFGPPGAEKVG